MACFSLFLFSLGSAPLFFLLLMVRDIVGIKDMGPMQTHFGLISSLFFVMAALASVLSAARGAAKAARGDEPQPSPATAAAATEQPPPTLAAPEPEGEPAEEAATSTSSPSTEPLAAEGAAAAAALPAVAADDVGEGAATAAAAPLGRAEVARRWNLMIFSTVSFGVVCAAIPLAALPAQVEARLAVLYAVGACLGLAFGSVYVRYQECTWTLLPDGADVANAMGFSAMTKMAGVGIGNFVVGLILDYYSSGSSGEMYELGGYLIMSAFCAVTVWCSAYFVSTIKDLKLQEIDETA